MTKPPRTHRVPLSFFPKHVNLGFQHGADLDQAGKVLQGTGKAMRHITLTKLSELDRPDIRAYLRLARRRTGRKRPRQPTAEDVVTRVKQKSPVSPSHASG